MFNFYILLMMDTPLQTYPPYVRRFAQCISIPDIPDIHNNKKYKKMAELTSESEKK